MTTHHLDTRLLHIGAAEFDPETGTAPVSIPAIRTSTVRFKNLEVLDRALTKRAAGERVVTYGIAGLDTIAPLKKSSCSSKGAAIVCWHLQASQPSASRF